MIKDFSFSFNHSNFGAPRFEEWKIKNGSIQFDPMNLQGAPSTGVTTFTTTSQFREYWEEVLFHFAESEGEKYSFCGMEVTIGRHYATTKITSLVEVEAFILLQKRLILCREYRNTIFGCWFDSTNHPHEINKGYFPNVEIFMELMGLVSPEIPSTYLKNMYEGKLKPINLGKYLK